MANSRFWGFVFGLAAGAVIGALQAPRSGAETRAEIKRFFSDTTGQALDRVGLTEDKRHELQHTVSDVRAKTATEVSSIVDRTTATIDRTARQVEEAASETRTWAADTAATVRARVGEPAASSAPLAEDAMAPVGETIADATTAASDLAEQASDTAADPADQASDALKDATS